MPCFSFRTSIICAGTALWLALSIWAEPSPADEPDKVHTSAEPMSAPADTTAEESSSHTLILPILGYSPDTSVMLGASALRFFQLDPAAETSVFSPVLIYTFKKQAMVFMGLQLYWGRNRLNILPSYEYFPDQFYGIGRETESGAEEDYTPEKIQFETAWELEVKPDLFLGVNYRGLRHRLNKIEDGGVLDSGLVTGVEKTTLSAPGLQLSLDTRENVWSPRQGLWLQSFMRFYRDTWGSDHRFTTYEIDLRGYFPLGDKASLACQLLYTTLDGDVPFFDLARLGGYSGLRGYKQSRFIDRTRALGRIEWRSGDIVGRFGGVVFAGLGDVASRPDQLTLAAELWTVGAGVRYTLDEDEQVKLRLDVGFGNDDSGFYLAFGEAF